jgi:mono/diheme cytochrome c family protein
MHYVRLAIFALAIGVGFAASAQTPTKSGPRANIAAGKELFHQHCSTCHGVDAKARRVLPHEESCTIRNPSSLRGACHRPI